MSTSSNKDAKITDIEDLHRNAILQKRTTYTDPSTGYTVYTELAHYKIGKCCGGGCRHCPFGWVNVKSDRYRNKRVAKAKSGDIEECRRLAQRIYAGTYYEDGTANNNQEKK